jgi:hypothetical protein
VQSLYKDLYAHSQAMLDDMEKGTDYFYWGRARAAVENTPDTELEKIFSGVSRQEIEEMFWGVKSGAIKANRQEAKLIEEVHHMVEDLGDVFWETKDRAFKIREALRKIDAAKGFKSDPNVAAVFTDRALGQTEVEVLARALGESVGKKKYPNSKWYDRMVRFFLPHFEPVKKILGYNNELRQQLQLMYKMDEPAFDAMSRYAKALEKDPKALTQLRGLASDTAEQLREVRARVEKLYGKEISVTQPLPEQEARIRDLFKKIRDSKPKQETRALEKTSETDMDLIDETLGKLREKEGLPFRRPMDEIHEVQLQIRRPQYARETGALRNSYLNATGRVPKNSAYDVQTSWTVTVQHAEPKTRTAYREVRDANGKVTNEPYTEHYTDYYTTTYSMSRNDVLQAKYEEVLRNQVTADVSEVPPLPAARTKGAWAVSASNGNPHISWVDETRVAQILKQGEKARGSEHPYRARIASAIEQTEEISPEAYRSLRNDENKLSDSMKALMKTRGELESLRDQLVAYEKLADGKISAQWANDIPKDFHDRNQVMTTRFNHMMNRIDFLHEQMRRRVPSIDIEYTLPKYEQQLAQLEAVHRKNRRIQTAMGVTAGAAAAGAGYVYQDEELSYKAGAFYDRLLGRKPRPKPRSYLYDDYWRQKTLGQGEIAKSWGL